MAAVLDRLGAVGDVEDRRELDPDELPPPLCVPCRVVNDVSDVILLALNRQGLFLEAPDYLEIDLSPHYTEDREGRGHGPSRDCGQSEVPAVCQYQSHRR